MHFTRFGIFLKFLKTKNAYRNFLYSGSLDPEQLTRGARRATLEARLAWSAGALPSSTGSQAPAMAGQGGGYGGGRGGGKGRLDQELTGNPPVGSAWPEDGRRR
jgi:hypothetical protein